MIWNKNKEIKLTVKYKFNNEPFEEKILICMESMYKNKIIKEEIIDHRNRNFL